MNFDMAPTASSSQGLERELSLPEVPLIPMLLEGGRQLENPSGSLCSSWFGLWVGVVFWFFFALIVLETVSSREGKLVLPLGGLQQSLFPFFPVVLCALGWCLWEQFWGVLLWTRWQAAGTAGGESGCWG